MVIVTPDQDPKYSRYGSTTGMIRYRRILPTAWLPIPMTQLLYSQKSFLQRTDEVWSKSVDPDRIMRIRSPLTTFPFKSLEFMYTWYDNSPMDFVCGSLQLVNELRFRHIWAAAALHCRFYLLKKSWLMPFRVSSCTFSFTAVDSKSRSNSIGTVYSEWRIRR